MSLRRARRLLLGTACAALAATAIQAAPASAATYQYDTFKLAGGTRFTIVVSRAVQVPGLPASAKGYRRICRESGPVVRSRLNFSYEGDVGSYTLKLYSSKQGAYAYSAFAGGSTSVTGPTGGPLPRTEDATLDFIFPGATAPQTRTVPSIPAPGLYDFLLVPYASSQVPGLSSFPVQILTAKMDVSLDTAGCLPTSTDPSTPPHYYRVA